MPGRRSFLIGCGGVVAAPMLALIDLTEATHEVSRPPPVDAPIQVESASATTREDLVLRIDGWDSPADAGHAANPEVWIHVNSSWRSSWR